MCDDDVAVERKSYHLGAIFLYMLYLQSDFQTDVVHQFKILINNVVMHACMYASLMACKKYIKYILNIQIQTSTLQWVVLNP